MNLICNMQCALAKKVLLVFFILTDYFSIHDDGVDLYFISNISSRPAPPDQKSYFINLTFTICPLSDALIRLTTVNVYVSPCLPTHLHDSYRFGDDDVIGDVAGAQK